MVTETTLFKAVTSSHKKKGMLAGCNEYCACDEVCVCDADTNPTECNCQCDLYTTCGCNPHGPGHSCEDK